MLLTPALVAAVAVDLIAITIVAVPLYFRRHRRRDLMLSYVALNLGVLGVALALSTTEVGIGLGLGLFGVLSIIRLRSDQISQVEIAYYFTSLALGLLAALTAQSVWLPAAFSVLLVGALYILDHPQLYARHQRRTITLDRAYTDTQQLRTVVAELLGAEVNRIEVTAIDLVRDITVVDVRYRAAQLQYERADAAMTSRRAPSGETPYSQGSAVHNPYTHASAAASSWAGIPTPVMQQEQ